MIASILVKIFIACVGLGLLALLPMILLNRKTSDTDDSMYKKGFSAKSRLECFKTNSVSKEPDTEKKLKTYKL